MTERGSATGKKEHTILKRDFDKEDLLCVILQAIPATVPPRPF